MRVFMYLSYHSPRNSIAHTGVCIQSLTTALAG
jgi:hypothetical protein